MDRSFDGVVTVRHVRYRNEATGWAVLDAAAADGTSVALVGPLVHLEQGERAEVAGTWVDDSRYGLQVKVLQAHPLAPEDPDALIAYLRRVKHVGATRAADLVTTYGPAEVLDRIDDDPAAAFERLGLRGQRAHEAAGSWQAMRVTRRLHLLLAPHGLAYLAPRLHDHYGADAHDVVSRNPYELTSVFGVGFLIADRIALGSRAGRGAEVRTERERAAVMHVLVECERTGSTCLPEEELLA